MAAGEKADRPRLTMPNLIRVLLISAAVGGCVLLYLHIAGIQYDVNLNMGSIDQYHYLNFAREAHETRLNYAGDRARMPLYPWILSFFYSSEMTDQEFFETGKQFNLWLSIVALLALGAAFFARFSRLYAGYAILCIAFLVFVLKSPVVQPELLYYSLFGFAFILALSNLSAPTWRKSLATGLLFGLAHFAKASVLPAMVIYVCSFGVLTVIRLWRRNAGRGLVARVGKYALLTVLAFLALLFPYLQESYENYGSYFYNVSTTFYVWYESYHEAIVGTRAAGDRLGYPDLPPEEIPTLQKYLRKHTLGHIRDRFRQGLNWLYVFSCGPEDSRTQLGYCSQAGAGLALIALAAVLLIRRRSLAEISDQGHIVFFVTSIFVAYTLAAAWYIPVGGPSPRQFLPLTVPFFWTLGVVTHAAPLRELRLWFGQRSYRMFDAVYVLLGLTLVYEIYLVLTMRAATMFGPL